MTDGFIDIEGMTRYALPRPAYRPQCSWVRNTNGLITTQRDFIATIHASPSGMVIVHAWKRYAGPRPIRMPDGERRFFTIDQAYRYVDDFLLPENII